MSEPTVIETVWIPLSDGRRLAARLWLPAGGAPQPAILEYLPYRRRDRHRGDDAILHPGFAAAGYAALRVDMAGSGDSDGVMTDEYTPAEWADAVEVIAWIAAQDWCSGAVGMIGLSWSGFNALQIAALAPPALKAIITTCASDDRFADDMHYMGGCLLSDNLQYGATLFTWLATPPDPAVVGERWREMWRARLEALTEPPAARWMRHSDRDGYWRSGSVSERYGDVQAAVLAVGGWADGYVNAVMRLLAGLPGPRKGLIGPWAHAFPHVASPGPQIDFIGYAVRWWDHWLKGAETGIMDEPMLTAWMQESDPPRAQYAARPGRWVSEMVWPSPRTAWRTLHLTRGGLAAAPEPFERSVRSPMTTGLASGEWCPYGWGPDMPTDQREDDAGSLCFDTEPLSAPLSLLGGAAARLTLAANQDAGMIAVRLCDVAPDGTSSRITYGLLDLRHHADFGRSEALPPGERTDIRVSLKDAGYEVPAGHRLRIAVATAYWPLVTPKAPPAQITLFSGSIALPVRPADGEPPPPALGDAWSPPPLDMDGITPPERGRVRIERRPADERVTVDVVRNLGAFHIKDVDLTLSALGAETHSVCARGDTAADLALESLATRRAEFRRGAWRAAVKTRSLLTLEDGAWRLIARIDAYDGPAEGGAAEGGAAPFFTRRWNLRIPTAAPSLAGGGDAEDGSAGS